MVAAFVIVLILFLASLALNFLFLWMLKNTLNSLEIAHNVILSEQNKEEAYDGKYYPGTVLATIKYDCEEDMIVTDFSHYDDMKLIGFTIHNTEPYPVEEFMKLGLERDEVEKPHLIPKVVVYAPRGGVWKWKYQD